MLNPVLSNIKITIGESFFPEALTKKYDDFLFLKNYPMPTLKGYLHETIQSIPTPGIDFQTIQVSDLNNTRGLQGNNGINPVNGSYNNHPVTQRTYPGTSPYADILTGLKSNITFKNTILNWLYIFEWMYDYYSRNRTVGEFDINLDMLDSAELPIIRFHFKDCYFSSLPELEFAYNQTFSESKTFDAGFTFNGCDIKMLIPDFDIKTMTF